MRAKVEDRKQAIIDVAVEVFREVGFERASMAMISHRLGRSKGTLYNYFQSKEELFETAMKTSIKELGDHIMDLLDPNSDDLRTVLEQFASAYLTFILGDDVLAFNRTAIAESANSSLGPHLYEKGPMHAVSMLTKFFSKQVKLGRLRKVSPLTISLHFKALIEVGFLDAALYGAKPELKKRQAVASAVDAFLHAYGTLG